MEETTSFLETKVSDLTVKQTIVFQVVAPIVVVGGMILAGGVYSGAGALARKVFKKKDLTIVNSDEA